MKNKFGFFGLLGLLGILGIVTDNRAFLGFFGFFVYFRYFTIIPDELFKEYIKKAATPSFFISIIIISITIALSAIIKDRTFLSIGFLIDFIITLFVFTILLMTYEAKESRSK
jgi:hypothetical protein